jgi:phosphoserine phosphatase RsbU/P
MVRPPRVKQPLYRSHQSDFAYSRRTHWNERPAIIVRMGDWDTSVLRSELIDRRARLVAARARQRDSSQLERLLVEVDAALGRMDDGSYGLCTVCHDPIERDRLLADPLMPVCIDHLDQEQRRALEQDLQLALRIQTRLLPAHGVRCAGWTAHFHYQPAGPVSGDFCDLVPDDTGRLFFAVGDVAGKGVAASLLMSHIHATFRTLLSVSAPIEEMLERANRLFSTSTMPAHYATLACGFAAASGEVEICNAGHCPPLVLRDGAIEPVEATGLPLGLFHNGQYSAVRARLHTGESLLLYTDGLTEARNSAGDEYGVERLMAMLPKCREQSPERISTACLEGLAAFLGSEQASDDLTMMVLRRAEA